MPVSGCWNPDTEAFTRLGHLVLHFSALVCQRTRQKSLCVPLLLKCPKAIMTKPPTSLPWIFQDSDLEEEGLELGMRPWITVKSVEE